MKFTLLVATLAAVTSSSQQVQNGKLDTSPQIDSTAGGTCPQMMTTLCIPLDGTFTPVDMNQPGGSGPASPADFCQRNDDDSGLYVLDAWSFVHFGTPFSEVYINNNGNISFGVPFSTFSPVGFPVSGFPMVAPFWGDVDTGDVLDTFGGVVWFKEESINNGDAVNRLTVIWDHVGYYNEHSDLINTFEVILTDGQDPLIGIGNNVCFCYDDMQWTTGDASGGVGGFGGSPATVGANEGNGVDFFQVGVFDHAGVDYDGPGGLVDGVSFLDESTICFNVSGMDPNVPPIFLGAPIGCLTADVGMDLMFDIDAIGPEVGQTVTLTVDSGGLANFACVLTPGNPATAACTFSPTVAQIGMHMITLTATDNGAPPLSAEIDVCLEVPCPGFFNNYCVGLAGTGGVTPLIAGTGCPIPGANITVDVTAGRSLALGCLLMSRTEASMPFYGGTLCVGFPTLIVRVHRLNAAGERTFPFTIPNDAGLIGETASFQSFYVDDGAASGISMTDGLRMNIGG